MRDASGPLAILYNSVCSIAFVAMAIVSLFKICSQLPGSQSLFQATRKPVNLRPCEPCTLAAIPIVSKDDWFVIPDIRCCIHCEIARRRREHSRAFCVLFRRAYPVKAALTPQLPRGDRGRAAGDSCPRSGLVAQRQWSSTAGTLRGLCELRMQ